MMILVPDVSRFKKDSNVFSTATLPTYICIGFVYGRDAGEPGQKSFVSTPRFHLTRFVKPCFSRMVFKVGVEYMVAPAALWNRFKIANPKDSGAPVRILRYCGNIV